MDEKGLNELWKTVLGEIETEVSRANYLTLFKNTALLSFSENVATIATPSNMIIDLLKKRFYPVIKTVLEKHSGTTITIVFIPKTFEGKPKEKDTPLFSNAGFVQVNQPPRRLSRVREDFTFETMAVSSSNQLAYVSAQTVARNLGKSYNPLFIYGPVGVGKTHLMQAIANEVYKKEPFKKIIYITSEEFTNEVVEAIRGNETGFMKKRFRTTNLLLIDDVQFIAGKDRVQEELFHTFNILIDNASQIVLSSDRPPSEIKKIEKRLSSRFSSGLAVDIEAPDFELRTAILLIKAKKYDLDLPIDIAKIISEHVEDVRSLEGTLLRVITEAQTKNSEITLDFVKGIIEGKRVSEHSYFHPDEVIKGVCQFYNVKPTLIKSSKRDANLVRTRHVLMYVLKKELGLTFVEIGNLLGGRDHTTIMHGVEKVELLLSQKPALSSELVGITKLLSEQNVNYS